VVIVLAGLAGVVAVQPNEFRIARKATIDAPPEAVFAHVNDFHRWSAWSPWIKLDPNAKNSFGGPDTGEGATFSWDGNSEVGAGKMTIIDSDPHSRIQIKLEFTRPMEDESLAQFDFKPAKGGTEVEWSMSGKHNFVSKAMCLVMDLDAMIGSKFDEGLASMKKQVEQAK